MTFKYDYSYLRGWIKQKFGNNRKYAKFLGIGCTALYDRLAGKTPFRQNEIDATAQYGNLAADDVMRFFFTKQIRKTV